MEFKYFQSTVYDLLRLWPTNGAMDGNLLVTTDAKCANSVASFGKDGLLAGQLLQNLEIILCFSNNL
jgi:hypothetical protein